jgi:hypothetical protein
MTPTVLVGLDVHARQTHATVLDRATGQMSACKLHGLPEEAAMAEVSAVIRPSQRLCFGP